MAEIDLPLPRLGETMEEGRIVTWLKQPGDRFRRGEILLEVETDKTVVEVPALQDGVMVRASRRRSGHDPGGCADRAHRGGRRGGSARGAETSGGAGPVCAEADAASYAVN